jgi:hypothetical protein
MVRAILDGRKTQTRRTIKPQPVNTDQWDWQFMQTDDPSGREWLLWSSMTPDGGCWLCPYGKPGDRLRISEEAVVAVVEDFDGDCISVTYPADNSHSERYADPELIAKVKAYKTGHLRGVHLPPAYARPTRLEITDVRVERLTDISEADAIAEGIHKYHDLELYGYDPKGTPGLLVGGSASEAFFHLWEKINGDGSVSANPWVWVIEFRKTEAAQ